MDRVPAYRVPRRLLLTLQLGEMPEHIPSLREVRHEGAARVSRIDGGPLDRILGHYGGAARSARLHSARVTRLMRPGIPGTRRFDDLEQVTGVARVLRIEVADDHRLPEMVQALAQVPKVERVYPDRICTTPFDVTPVSQTQSMSTTDPDPVAARRPRSQIRLPQALALQSGDPAVMVGLADTGVAQQHPELQHRIRSGFDTVDLSEATMGDLVLVGDATRRDEDPDDDVGHGSACAGILRANGNKLPAGGCGLCGVTPVRVLGAALSGEKRIGVGSQANIDEAMKRITEVGVKIINMSFGTSEFALGPDDPLPHEEVVRYALARGVILVAASGNSGKLERYYPAAHPGVIAVGAVSDRGVPCSFSTRGEHVALCAPGQDIWTCGLQGYARVSGTSFAAPFTSAVCALMAAEARRRAWPLDPETVREILTTSAQPFPANNQTEGCGAGILDAYAALQRLNKVIDAELFVES